MLALGALLAGGCEATPGDVDGAAGGSRGDAGASGGGDAGASPDSDAGAPGSPPPCPVGAPGDTLTVATDRGLVRGELQGAVLSFAGIPYAAPPVGARRFRPPEPHACWNGAVDATKPGSICPQKDTVTGAPIGDESCLFLNVWTPGTGEGAARPVLVFIHGGGNLIGGGHQSPLFGFAEALGIDLGALGLDPGLDVNIYDGGALAASQDAVVVTLNYRLGKLGFMAHPALSAESSHGASGNYGVLDQIAALRWVQANIGSFGGDPSRVLVFGESSGAYDVCALLASPLASGLFRAALLESGDCVAVTAVAQHARGEQTAKSVGCGAATDVASCLRAVPAASLVETQGAIFSIDPIPVLTSLLQQGTGVDPTVDGWVLPEAPMARIAHGAHNKVPVVVGTTAHEAEILLAPPTTLAPCFQYAAQVTTWFGAHAPAVLELYPCTLLDGHAAAVDLLSDKLFTCPARRIARAIGAAQTAPVHRYWFTHGLTVSPMSILRSFHGVELLYVFQTMNRVALPTPAEITLAGAVGGYWARLASAGDPNGGGAAPWEPYVPGLDNALVLDTSITMKQGIRTPLCDFWDTLDAP